MSYYKTITVGQYQDLCSIDTELSPFERLVYIVSILKGITFDDALKIKVQEMDMMKRQYERTNFTMLDREPICKHVTLEGKVYDVISDPKKLTAGQLLDNINLLKEQGDKPIDIMHRRIATMVKPKNKNYSDGLKGIEKAKLIQDLPLYKVYSAHLFFFNRWNFYYTNSEAYLSQEMDKAVEIGKEILRQNGGFSD